MGKDAHVDANDDKGLMVIPEDNMASEEENVIENEEEHGSDHDRKIPGVVTDDKVIVANIDY